MEELSGNEMDYVFYIILRGPAGVGKSTISGKLAQFYNGHHIDVDKIKKKLRLSHSKEDKFEVNKTVIQKARYYLNQRTVVIIDEVFYFKLQLLQIEQLPYKSYLFSLNAPLETCLKRNLKRRQEGLATTTDETIKLVHSLVFKLKKGIEINTHDVSIKEALNEILSYLPKISYD
ncbi:ATP-binding protein [Candidatus Pacearchaeota archaeon]|nr:ATP-binding protein [Candidatus Pacearchaeota archaeon]